MTTIYAGTQGFSLTYYTTDGIWSDSHYLNPAVSGVDYQGISEDSPQTLYFPVGNSSQTITVPTMLANVNDDYDRAFTLMFSGDTFDAHTVGVLLPVYGTVTVRPDANGDGVFDTTDDFLNAIAPAPICVEGQGPRTMVQLTESVYVPSGSSGVTGNFLAVLPYVTGLDFWTSPEGENQLTPDENGNIICDSFSTQYTRTIWVSIDPSGTFTGDPITLDLDAASNNQQTEMVALPAASPGVAAVTPDADPAKPGPTQAGWAAAVQPAQQQTYTLTGRIVGQKAGLWGNFSFGIKWNISPAAIKVAGRPANGWIIQHIQVTYDVRGRVPGQTLGPQPVNTHDPLDDGRWNYWEAWKVTAGHVAPVGVRLDDTFSNSLPPVNGKYPLQYTNGHIVFSGTAQFYPNCTLPPATFIQNNPALGFGRPPTGPSRASSLPASLSAPPASMVPASNVFDHTIIVDWTNWNAYPPNMRPPIRVGSGQVIIIPSSDLVGQGNPFQ